MNKEIIKRTDLAFKEAFPGLKGVDIMAHSFPIEPFLVFTEFYMNRPVFGPHPHAGISVMTYILPDSKGQFINRDSLGDFSIIESGGVHVTQSGSGMFHDEFPRTIEETAHGFQIWINHSEQQRFIEPTSMHANANEIPVIETEGFTLRLIQGEFEGVSASFQLATRVQLYHLTLKKHKTVQLKADQMAFIYGLKGEAKSNNEAVYAQTLVNYSLTGEVIELTTKDNEFECMFASANPLNEQIIYGGPFVMTTSEQMKVTQQRYNNGEMGHLEKYNP